MKLKMDKPDFNKYGIGPECIFISIQNAQCAFQEWLGEQRNIYGVFDHIDHLSFEPHLLPKPATHKAKLVCLEEIKKCQ